MGTSGARHATEYRRVIAAVGATGEPPQEDTVEELISREHALIRRHPPICAESLTTRSMRCP